MKKLCVLLSLLWIKLLQNCFEKVITFGGGNSATGCN